MKVTDQQILTAFNDRTNVSFCAIKRAVGLSTKGSNDRVKKVLAANNCDTTLLLGQASQKGKKLGARYALATYLVLDGKKILGTELKLRLIAEGIKEARCEHCKNVEWLGNPIPLELDHINGNNRDNRLMNLRLLCPNCHALTPTYRGRNIKHRGDKIIIDDVRYREAIESSANSAQALRKLGLRPYGGNYRRVQRVKEKFDLNFRPRDLIANSTASPFKPDGFVGASPTGVTSVYQASALNELRKQKVQEAKINFQDWGWIRDVSILTGIPCKKVTGWLRKNLPALYLTSRRQGNLLPNQVL